MAETTADPTLLFCLTGDNFFFDGELLLEGDIYALEGDNYYAFDGELLLDADNYALVGDNFVFDGEFDVTLFIFNNGT